MGIQTYKEISYRPGTQDYQAFNEVIVRNEYRLPEKLPDGARIIDLGAHVGFFALACLARVQKSARILCYEPDPDNYELLVKNVGDSPFVSTLWKAIAEEVGLAKYKKYHDKVWTCCGSTMMEMGGSEDGAYLVKSDSLDQAISSLGDRGIDDGEPVDLIKMDIEGAEYGVLYSCTKIDRVKNLAIEVHGMWDDGRYEYSCDAEGIVGFLRDHGFETHVERPMGYKGGGFAANAMVFAWNKRFGVNSCLSS